MSRSGVAVSSHAERLLAIVNDAPAAGDRPRVLVVDPDPSTAALLETLLPRSEAEILSAGTVEATRELLAAESVSLILCNPVVSGDLGERFFAQLMEHAEAARVPVIAIKGDAVHPDEATIYGLGAEAILRRPFQGRALVALVRSHLRKIAQRQGHLLQDPITGRPNISVFREAFQRASFLAAREHEPLALLVLHVGALRQIRRETGIPAADEVLRMLSGSVADALRKSDLLARGSGDSLLILLPNTDRGGAARVIEKVHDRLVRRLSRSEAGAAAELSLSVGVAEAAPHAAFDAVLEAALSHLEPVWSAAERAYSIGAHEATTGMPSILIAEDDALTAAIIKHRLERLGYEVVHVSDGAELLRVAPDVNASLLILDVKMPYVDGFEALRRLRSIRPMRDVPVVMLTSMGNEEDIAHGFELGADDYLVKPFSPIELQARVQRLLKRCG